MITISKGSAKSYNASYYINNTIARLLLNNITDTISKDSTNIATNATNG